MTPFIMGVVALSFLVNTILLRVLKNHGTNKRALEVRWSLQAKPTIGGVSFFIGLAVGLLYAINHFGWPEELDALRLMTAALAAFLMGLADDIWHTRPGGKLIVQVACGVLLFYGGLPFSLFPDDALNLLLTVMWTVTLMNSINMLDNMDAISGITACAVLIALWLFEGDTFFGLISLAMAATVLGFLVLNFNPSKIFMGDAGSQLLGFVLAGTSLSAWSVFRMSIADLPEGDVIFALTGGCIAIVTIFFTSLCDTALVTLNRMRHKCSPFRGGKDHSTHNLYYLGMKEKQIALLFLLWSVLNVFLARCLIKASYTGDLKIFLLVGIYLLVVYVTFIIISHKNLKAEKFSYTL